MTLARILDGNYPYITNVPVYDGAALVAGEMIMEDANFQSDATRYYITAAGATTAEAEQALGVLQAGDDDALASKENSKAYGINADSLPDDTAAEGFNFLPCIVNPEALYFAFIDQADAVSCTSTVSASTTFTLTAVQQDTDAGWVYTTAVTDTSATNSGQLRYITEDSTNYLTVATAVTADSSTDIVWVFPIGFDSIGLNAEATGIRPGGTGATPALSASGTTDIKVFEQWITHAHAPKHKLRYWNDKGLDNLDKVQLEQEIVMFVHSLRKE